MSDLLGSRDIYLPQILMVFGKMGPFQQPSLISSTDAPSPVESSSVWKQRTPTTFSKASWLRESS